ncbi:MAG: AMP-binding protein, partial [Polyangiaceae bacterium]
MTIADIRPPADRLARHIADGHWTKPGAPTGVAHALRAHAKRNPNKTLVVDRLGKLTYAEVEELAARIAHNLRALGIGRLDAVLVQLPNWREALIVQIALESLEAVTIPVPAMYRAREVSFMARLTTAKAAFVPAGFGNFDFLDMLRTLRTELPTLEHVFAVEADGVSRPRGEDVRTFDSLVSGSARLTHAELEVASLDPDSVVEIGFTSGSTGDPKGAVHTSNTLCAEHVVWSRAFGLGESDVLFMPSTVGHQIGWTAMRTGALLGATVLFIDRWEVGAAIDLMTREGATFTFTTPAFLYDVVQSPRLTKGTLAAMKTWVLAGQVVTSALRDEAHAKLPHIRFSHLFGMTEMGCTIMSDKDVPPEKVLATGRAQPSVEVAAREEGELVVKSASLFLGYYQRDDLTEAAYTSDGFFRTGDQVTIDADGYVQVTGRIKDLIKRGGESVSPGEIEEILVKHPKIAEVSVVGVPDTRLGERVCVFVVPRPGETVTLEDVTAFVGAAKLAKQKWPERIEIVDALP